MTDEDGLSQIKEIDLKISTGNCPPKILSVASTLDCIVSGSQFEEDVLVFDRDLLRTGSSLETLTLTVSPNVFSIVPSTITGGTGVLDTQIVKLVNSDPGGINIP